MYDHTLHCLRKHFCRYSLKGFSRKEILKYHFKDCFKINGEQSIRCLKKVNMLNSKIMRKN